MLKRNVSLKDFSNYKIGGNAAYFLEVSSKNDLIKGIKQFRGENPNGKIFILGGATNILIRDEGIDGLAIHNNILGIERNGDNLTAGSMESMVNVNRKAIEESLSGLEWSGGLPGSIGGAVRGNAGAFGGEMKDSVSKVESVDLTTLEEKIRDNVHCEFGYRTSIFKTQGTPEFIISVTVSLTLGDKKQIKQATLEKIEYRKAKHPLEYPSAGSVFKNVSLSQIPQQLKEQWKEHIKNDPFPVIPAAVIIALAGLSGIRSGDALLSEKHTNFIVNLGNAKATDVKAVIEIIKKTVREKFGIQLEEEIIYL